MSTREPTGAATPRVRPVDGFGWKNGLQASRGLTDEELLNLPSAECQALQRFSTIAGDWWDQFQVAYIEYGPGAADETGLAGQWGDLHRKVKKLKRFMWEGDVTHLKRETPREVLQDLIGHCFLAIEMLDRGMQPGRSSASSARPSSSVTGSLLSSREPARCSDEECVNYGCPL